MGLQYESDQDSYTLDFSTSSSEHIEQLKLWMTRRMAELLPHDNEAVHRMLAELVFSLYADSRSAQQFLARRIQNEINKTNTMATWEVQQDTALILAFSERFRLSFCEHSLITVMQVLTGT